MKNTKNIPVSRVTTKLGWWGNVLGAVAIILILTVTLHLQLSHREMLFPLYQLQRVSIAVVGLGFLMNVVRGARLLGYTVILLGAAMTGIIMPHPTFLQMLPGNSGYGLAVLGLHYYDWAVAASFAVVFYTALLLLVHDGPSIVTSKAAYLCGTILSIIMIVIIAASLVSSVLECGLKQCDSSLIQYNWLREIDITVP